jgi:hypothetical protein
VTLDRSLTADSPVIAPDHFFDLASWTRAIVDEDALARLQLPQWWLALEGLSFGYRRGERERCGSDHSFEHLHRELP